MKSVFAILVGVINLPAKPYLLSLKGMNSTGAFVSQYLMENLYTVLNVKAFQFRLLVTDRADCCIKTGQTLKSIFSKSVARNQCSSCNTFGNGRCETWNFSRKRFHFISRISSVKVHRQAPNFPVSIPPWPVLTRCGTWGKFGIFLVMHWEPIFNWVNSLDQAGSIV